MFGLERKASESPTLEWLVPGFERRQKSPLGIPADLSSWAASVHVEGTVFWWAQTRRMCMIGTLKNKVT